MTTYAGKDVEQGELITIANMYKTLGINTAISQKIQSQPTLRSSNTTLGHIPKGCSIIPQGYLLNYVHSSFIHDSQNLETT